MVVGYFKRARYSMRLIQVQDKHLKTRIGIAYLSTFNNNWVARCLRSMHNVTILSDEHDLDNPDFNCFDCLLDTQLFYNDLSDVHKYIRNIERYILRYYQERGVDELIQYLRRCSHEIATT